MNPYRRKIGRRDMQRLKQTNGDMVIGQIGLLLGCNYRTIKKGITELKQPNLSNSPRIRHPGGGRKKKPLRRFQEFHEAAEGN
jgi:hypothetical protein